MSLKLVKHEKLSLKKEKGFQETWLHDQIENDTSIIGLGELEIIERERIQYSGGRLDLLLADTEKGIRYEVEIMLGATDASHIIRCIEYWDIEKRRYPAYDHVAVIVAEEITTRFLNVLALFSGSIPLVAIQLNALKVQDSIVLDFVKVLDQRALREDDTIEPEGQEVDREWWETKKGADKVQLCDRFLAFAQEGSDIKYELRYKKSRISICPEGSFFVIANFYPKVNFVRSSFKVSDVDAWIKKLEENGLDADSPRDGRVRLRLSLSDLSNNEEILKELIKDAANNSDE